MYILLRKTVDSARFTAPNKSRKNCFLLVKKTPLRCFPDAIMMLTFFDAVVIAIATCSYRDSNMMLSSCVHVVIKLTTCCQFEEMSL